jgi:pantoate--beta-alanine ligase
VDIVALAKDLRGIVRRWRDAGETIALVPTMGNLHEGHLSLVQLAAREAKRVVVSVFVNPAQFGPGEDYAAYPRTPDADLQRLGRAPADVLFTPGTEEMYSAGDARGTMVSVPGLSAILCGAFRPGHFDGVTSVVARLFNVVQPDVAVFGQKDYQQLVIIRRMQSDLHFPVRVVDAPTVREADGLAMSSRNQYLSPDERRLAPRIHAQLLACGQSLRQGRRDYPGLEAEGAAGLAAAGLKPDYFAIRAPDDLAEPGPGPRRLVILTAVRIGRARLIDNILVDL